MATLITVIVFCIGIYLVDKICLWLEGKGWLYYRHEKPRGGVIGNSLLELHAILNPATHHIIQMKENQVSHKRSEADAPSDIKK